MKKIVDHHHYKKDMIPISDRVAVYERYIIDLLITSDLEDGRRDSSIAFELKHHHSTAQFARVLSRKRHLPIDICTVGALLHDLFVIQYGSYSDHAHKSAELAMNVLNELGGFNCDEEDKIISIIYHHSDKHIWSKDPYIEFGKDVDILDSFLYPGAFGYYLKNKKLSVFSHYILRAKHIWDELNIPQPPDFQILDNFCNKWLDYSFILNYYDAQYLLHSIAWLNKYGGINNDITLPTICLLPTLQSVTVFINEINYQKFVNCLSHCFSVQTDTLATDWKKIYKHIVGSCDEALLEGVYDIFSTTKGLYIVLWSAMDSYEELNKEHDYLRLEELGIINSI